MERLTNPMHGTVRAIRFPREEGAALLWAGRLAAYEDLNRTPEELATDLAELKKIRKEKERWLDSYREDQEELKQYRKKGPVEELERVVRCEECAYLGGCISQCIPAALTWGFCSRGERKECQITGINSHTKG